jgi:hypothetical protein
MIDRIRKPACLLILTVLVICACAQKRDKPPGDPQVHHVVICWLKEPGNEEARRQLIEASRSFESIPGVVRVSAGPALPNERAVADSSFDIAIVMTFTDRNALARYLQHPQHKKAAKELLRPLTQKTVVYDFLDSMPAPQ